MEAEVEDKSISCSLQILIAFEWIPYFITVAITSTIVNTVLSHPELDWDEVYSWRCFCFVGYTFFVLSLANYGDRLSNGRFYLFVVFSILSIVWTPLIFLSFKHNAILVLIMCLQPIMLVKEASRLCYVLQMLRLPTNVSRVRVVTFFLFLIANMGAFFACISFSNANSLLLVAFAVMPVYAVFSLSAMCGSNIVAHRNISTRGFNYFVRKLASVLCRWKTIDCSSMYDEEIRTSADCIMKISVTLSPLILFFATLEMTFHVWVRDYDVLQDLGFEQWKLTLVDIYHGLNVVCVLVAYVVIVPLVQCCTKVPDLVLIGISFFLMLLSWVTVCCIQVVSYIPRWILQSSNELRQTRYPRVNESKIVIFSHLRDTLILSSYWSEARYMNSGDVSVSLLSGITRDTWTDVDLYSEMLPEPQLVRRFKIRAARDLTRTYLLTLDGDNTLQLESLGEHLDRHFEIRTKNQAKLFGHLFILCSHELLNKNLSLTIRAFHAEHMEFIPICCIKGCVHVKNLTVGWYELHLRNGSLFVPLDVLLEMKKEALMYLYIDLRNAILPQFSAELTELITPFFMVEVDQVLMQLTAFSWAYSLGIVALHSFIAKSSPFHLLEYGFAILYSTWSIGAGLAGAVFPIFCASAKYMFFWVFVLAVGLMLFVRNAAIFMIEGSKCGAKLEFSSDERARDASPEWNINDVNLPGKSSAEGNQSTSHEMPQKKYGSWNVGPTPEDTSPEGTAKQKSYISGGSVEGQSAEPSKETRRKGFFGMRS